MVVWFVTLAVLGVRGISRDPAVLPALDPRLRRALLHAPAVDRASSRSGAVVLCVTGAEALYADMGHFGRPPIRLAWFALVFPALVLNYFGQGALLLERPGGGRQPVLPAGAAGRSTRWWCWPPSATVIASQAVISGAFSVTQQAIQLGYLPRIDDRHTSEREMGQIYVPPINWRCIVAVVAARARLRVVDALAAAYGIAVTGTMVTTTSSPRRARRHVGLADVARRARVGCVPRVDLAFFGANALKIAARRLVPAGARRGIFVLMTTWFKGRA